MSKFNFSLEGVLKHRRHVEQERMRALAVVQTQMAEMKGELAGIEQTVRDSTEEMRGSRLIGTLDMSFIAAHRRFVAGMQGKAMELVRKMARLATEVESAQKALAESAKDRKIMEKLREKRFDRWRMEESKKELAALDEIGMQMAAVAGDG